MVNVNKKEAWLSLIYWPHSTGFRISKLFAELLLLICQCKMFTGYDEI
jgi:hypothetical protein